MSLSGTEVERLVVVGSDLEYLQSLPQDRLLTHTEVRLCAGVLRRLLIDDQLAKLWRHVESPQKVKQTVKAVDIDSILSEWPQHWIRYGWAGGSGAPGAHHRGLIVAVVPRGEWETYGSPEAFFEAKPPPVAHGELRRMTLGNWLRSTSVAIQTNEVGLVRISRAAVIHYIANRKGGVHFDPTRNLLVKGKKNRTQQIQNHLLDHGLLRVGHLSGPEFEIASMVRALAEADWAQGIVRFAQDAVPEDLQGNPNELKFWTGQQEADGTGWATMNFADSAASEGPPGET